MDNKITTRLEPGSSYQNQRSNFTITITGFRADSIRILAWLVMLGGALC